MQDPLVINNYGLIKETGMLDYINSLRVNNMELEDLLTEAYEIFRKESVEELVSFIIECLSDKFVPSNLIFILNQGIMVNKIKTLVYKNLKPADSEILIDSLEPYEPFFRRYSGTTSYLIFEDEISDPDLLSPFKNFNPEIVVPVEGRSGLYGIIMFGPKVLEREYTPNEIAYINRLMKFTSIGIQNNIHYEHSVRDAKTGLYNHNFFIRRVEEEVSRSRRSGNTFSVIMMDIDHFKLFNDTYGHLAGDEIILNLAEKIRQIMRDQDILSRFGGEEFIVLLPMTDSEEARMAAERLREAVESMSIDYKGQELSITISIGIASYRADDGYNTSVISRADAAMYQSKSRGRNCSTVSESEEISK